MRQDWVEFENANGVKFSLRPEYIQAIEEIDDGTKVKNLIKIIYGILNDGTAVMYGAKGTYEQVKQKIMDAEKVDYSDVVVERFTKDEYELLLNAIGFLEASYIGTRECYEFSKQIEPLGELRKKLNKIIKEILKEM